MRDKLISYIDYLFEDAPQGSEELKSEIRANTLDRYDDLIAAGKSADEAFNAAAAGIGDVGALLNEMRGKSAQDPQEKNTSLRAVLLSVAVALYIFSVAPVILFDGTNLSVCVMFLMIAVATGLIIYRATAFKKYEMKSQSQTEQFKARKSEEDDKTALRRSISGALWSVTVLVYLAVSFMSSAWHITWLIFLIAVALENILKLAFQLKK